MKRLPPGIYMRLSSPEALRAWLIYRGLSYEDLGRCAGVSKQFIGQLANGSKRTCRPETAEKIEKALLPRPDLRGPNDLPLFVARSSVKAGEVPDSVGGRA